MGQRRNKQEILIGQWQAGVSAAKELIRSRLRLPAADPLSDGYDEDRRTGLEISGEIDQVAERLKGFVESEEVAKGGAR